jgi:hypothetical protein
MIKALEGMTQANFIRIKHLKELPIEQWDKEFQEHIIVDHDMNTVTFKMNAGNQRSMSVAMCEIAKALVK